MIIMGGCQNHNSLPQAFEGSVRFCPIVGVDDWQIVQMQTQQCFNRLQ